MTVYWAKINSVDATAPHGFFDADGDITLLWSRRHAPLDPYIVTTHELVHVNIAQNSCMGVIEAALTVFHAILIPVLPFHRTSDSLNFEQIRVACLDRLRIVRSFCEDVHEAVAWLSTEEVTGSRESIQTPKPYRRLVGVLRESLVRIGGMPNLGTDGFFTAAMQIGEAIAIAALGGLKTQDVLTAATSGTLGVAGRRPLLAALSAREMNPTRRFVKLCDWFAKRSLADVLIWANSQYDPYVGDVKIPIPFLDWREVDRQVPAILAQFAAAVGLWHLADERLMTLVWERSKVFGRFQKSVDRYAQCTILGERSAFSEKVDGLVEKYGSDEPPVELYEANVLTVGAVDPPGSDRVGWRAPIVGTGYTALHGVRLNRRETMPNEADMYSKWVTEQRFVRSYLADVAMPARIPIVATGIGYDFALGDFYDGQILDGLPHAVVVGGSFWSWWRRISMQEEAGLYGSTSIEWLPMRSFLAPGGPFGYIVMKPRDHPWPVVVIPICIGEIDRVVSVSELPIGATKVAFERLSQAPDQRLGESMWLASAAVQVYEATGI